MRHREGMWQDTHPQYPMSFAPLSFFTLSGLPVGNRSGDSNFGLYAMNDYNKYEEPAEK